MTKTRWERPYSNTGLGRTPSARQIGSLLRNARIRSKRCAAMIEDIKEKAKHGDATALRQLKRIHAARFQNCGKKVAPTKVQFSWDKENEDGNHDASHTGFDMSSNSNIKPK